MYIHYIIYIYIIIYLGREKYFSRLQNFVFIIGCQKLEHIGLIGEYQVASCIDDEVYSIEQTIFQKFYAAVFLDK